MFTVSDELFNTLSNREKRYFKIMRAQAGVLFLMGEPGIAKSAIAMAIAKKLKMNYIDIRLSMMDETDVGLFPFRKEVMVTTYNTEGQETSRSIQLMGHAIPEWAYQANQHPTIIHFEELNRAPLAVRNAALQILLDRKIGNEFQFNENVLMISSGNLGEEDGTDVEEFDRALNNRLVHYKHTLTPVEWINEFAEKNVHKTIVSFIKNYETHFLHSNESATGSKKSKDSKQVGAAYPTPRSWTHLSQYIICNFGKDSEPSEFIDDMREISACYVGTSAATSFTKFIEDNMKLSVNDVLNNFKQVKELIANATRDKKSELLNTLKDMDLNQLKPNQQDNMKDFLMMVSEDEITAFLLHIMDTYYEYDPIEGSEEEAKNAIIENFLLDDRFEKFFLAIQKHDSEATELQKQETKQAEKEEKKGKKKQ